MTIPARYYLELKPDDPVIQSERFAALEDAFFTSLRSANGSWKTTGHHRLDPINEIFFEVLARNATPPATVMDIGIASGITTLEWLGEYERRGLRIKMIATDISLTVYIVTLGRDFRVMVEPGGSIMQAELLGRGIRLWCGWRDFLNGSFIVRWGLSAIARRRLGRLGIAFPIGDVPQRAIVSGPYRLVSPRLRGRAEIVLVDDNILAPNRSEFVGIADVIRIANVLQYTYFSDEQIRTAVRNIRDRCRGEGSLVVVCRDKMGDLEGSILRLAADRFVLEERLGPGSEVERYFTE